MKFKCINEMEQICFDDSEISEFRLQERQMEFTFNGATIKAGNSQNARDQLSPPSSTVEALCYLTDGQSISKIPSTAPVSQLYQKYPEWSSPTLSSNT